MTTEEFLTCAGQMIAVGILFRGKTIRYGTTNIKIGETKFSKAEIKEFLKEANKIDENLLAKNLTKTQLEAQKSKVNDILKKTTGNKKVFFEEIGRQLDGRIYTMNVVKIKPKKVSSEKFTLKKDFSKLTE